MTRIVYLLLSNGAAPTGGQKMAVRHVETLRALGFDAIGYVAAGSVEPRWFNHTAPLVFATPVREDDIIVVPSDALEAMALAARSRARAVVFAQSLYDFAADGFTAFEAFQAPPPVICVSDPQADTLRRALPSARIEVVPCFADERIFRPLPHKNNAVAFVPRKRPLEARATRALFERIHAHHAGLAWWEVARRSETEVARMFGAASLHFSLSRLESLGMTPLEAMASGCLCAGFLGVGGKAFATFDNGFWAPDDDCEAAADSLAAAADLFLTGGPGARTQARRRSANRRGLEPRSIPGPARRGVDEAGPRCAGLFTSAGAEFVAVVCAAMHRAHVSRATRSNALSARV
jgi:hypothetical protein